MGYRLVARLFYPPIEGEHWRVLTGVREGGGTFDGQRDAGQPHVPNFGTTEKLITIFRQLARHARGCTTRDGHSYHGAKGCQSILARLKRDARCARPHQHAQRKSDARDKTQVSTPSRRRAPQRTLQKSRCFQCAFGRTHQKRWELD